MGGIFSSMIQTIDAFFKLSLGISEILLGIAVTGGVLAILAWSYVSYSTVSAIRESGVVGTVATAVGSAIPGALIGAVTGGPAGAVLGAAGGLAGGSVPNPL